ncbi:MAG: TetR/AcrR family transcriptional regulator [Candidatus Velthaea sp.]
MGITERKERQKAELRNTILAAARKIFLTEGAEAMTMRKIADAIEYSPGTIYLYFESREEIALHLVREGFEKLLDAFRPAIAVDDPVERLRAIGNAYIEFGLSDPETYNLIFMEDAKYVYAVMAPEGGKGEIEPGQRAFDVLATAVREAVECGQLRPVDPERGAEAMWAALHGVISLHITCPNMIGDVRAVATLISDAMLAGMRA